jgi:uncharacterized protein (TIGR02231 family)
MKTLKTEITDVTVFTDRAQVTRSVSLKPDKGMSVFVFDDLPEKIEKNSIQANGRGNAVLKDIKFKSVHFSETPDIDTNELLKKKEELQDRLTDLDDIINHSNIEKTFLQNILLKLTYTSPNEKINAMPDPDPEKWGKMDDFCRARLDSLDKEIRTSERSKRKISGEIDKIGRQLADSGNKNYKIKNQVEVSVDMKEAGDLVLNLSYIVYGPSWHPVYDIRVSSAKKIMTLEYNAVVSQSTGEDWENTSINLSTAHPGIGGRQPELLPWYIDIYQPVPYQEAAPRGATAPPAPVAGALSQMMNFSKDTSEIEKKFEGKGPDLIVKESAVAESGFTSAVFAINGRGDIPGDNLPHKLTIMIQDLPAHFRYSSIPKLSQFAYLKAKTVNETEFPFLPGETSIFLDGSFVANSSLDFVSPSEEFWTFLGIDEGMKIEYKLIKKYHKDEGVISKRTRLIYEYLTTITNNKKTKEEIVIWDQLPVSNNAGISVILITPELKKDAENPKKNELDYLEWYFEANPGEKIKIPFKFIIEYPKDKSVSGI